jgi:hypothetical protein
LYLGHEENQKLAECEEKQISQNESLDEISQINEE